MNLVIMIIPIIKLNKIPTYKNNRLNILHNKNIITIKNHCKGLIKESNLQ